MKSILFLVFTIFQTPQESKELNWYTLEEVQVLMKSQPRKVFIDVVADWCKWCKVMENETFTDPAVIQYINENYYAVRMEYESLASITFQGETSNYKALAARWNVRDLPAIVFWDENFESKFLSTGYRKSDQFLVDLKSFNEF